MAEDDSTAAGLDSVVGRAAASPGGAAADSVVGRVGAQLSSGRHGSAVEPPAVVSSRARSRRDLVAGICLGVAGVATAIQLWLAVELGNYATMYAQLRAPIPAATTFVISPAWRFGSPVLVAILIALAGYRRRERPWLPPVVALAACAIVIATYFLAILPISQLSGTISG